ncbi:MAG TPA: hypothetical protein VHM02_00165 [Thermoanaerobaculia bacterium]|nr:hypothetical protein [Thermoanaerobaculia bacterium]
MGSGKAGGAKGEVAGRGERPLALAAIGLEAELELWVDERKVDPARLFGNPTGFIRQPLVHREGTSYHLPTGGAVYFDTGVVEVATPVIEIERGCAARAGRSLWEGIRLVRRELDAWEERSGRRARLAGFSTHYNISFTTRGPAGGGDGRRQPATVEDLAFLLVHALPPAAMLLAANRRSTGIGVRPRGGRIEITADFTPSASLMISTAALVTGAARDAMGWPSFDLAELDRHRVPRIDGFQPLPHSSRQGWVARAESFSADPFTTPPDEPAFPVGGARRSLREIGRDVYLAFRPAVRRIAEPFTARMLDAILLRHAPTLLDLRERPAAYDDVGRLCRWDDLFPERLLSRSRYERVLIRAIAGDVLRMNGHDYRPVGMRGWSEVVFERVGEGTRHRVPIDFLLQHLDRWERSGTGRGMRRRPRRVRAAASP